MFRFVLEVSAHADFVYVLHIGVIYFKCLAFRHIRQNDTDFNLLFFELSNSARKKYLHFYLLLLPHFLPTFFSRKSEYSK